MVASVEPVVDSGEIAAMPRQAAVANGKGPHKEHIDKNESSNNNTALSDSGLQVQFVQQKLQQFQASVMRDVEQRVCGMIEEVLQQMRQHELQMHEFRHFASQQEHPAHLHSSSSQSSFFAGANKSSSCNGGVGGHTQKHAPLHRQSSSRWNNRVLSSPPETPSTANDDEEVADASASSDAPTKAGAPTTTLRAPAKRPQLPEKVFVVRESYLTALLEIDHMRTIYNIFCVILTIYLLNSVCYDYFVEGSIRLGLGTFKSSFGGIHHVLGVWLLEHVFVGCLFYAFGAWAQVRAKLHGRSQTALRRFWSHSCLIAYIASQLIFGYAATVMCFKLELPYVSAVVLLLESTRLLMKMHAFVRTNAARVLAGKLKLDAASSDPDQTATKSAEHGRVVLPTLASYVYFLFAPTLIYRDRYPRTAIIRWRFAAARFLEVWAIAFMFSYIHERYIRVHFVDIGREALTRPALLAKLFGMVMPGIVIFLGGFYLLLHSWLNFTGELLRFGDRMFYKDWWTSSTYEGYYRNWNVVVHDWLYEYIYRDFYMHVFGGSKLAASLTVFMVSALVHEHVLGIALRVFFPVMFVFFGVIGVSMVFITRRAPKTLGNVLLWFSLIVGNGLIISLYAMEYYARRNCPKVYETWTDYITPAILGCQHS